MPGQRASTIKVMDETGEVGHHFRCEEEIYCIMYYLDNDASPASLSAQRTAPEPRISNLGSEVGHDIRYSAPDGMLLADNYVLRTWTEYRSTCYFVMYQSTRHLADLVCDLRSRPRAQNDVSDRAGGEYGVL